MKASAHNCTILKLSVGRLDLPALSRQLDSDMSGLFNGHIAGYITDGAVCFTEDSEPMPDVEALASKHQLFLPFTSPDAEGGMIYADRSPVPFERDLEEDPYGESDCYGFLVSRSHGEYLVESGLCTLNTVGPCHCHYFEAVGMAPDSDELRDKMETFVKRFVTNSTRNTKHI